MEYTKHRESGIQWNRAFDIKLSHASSIGESSPSLNRRSESDKVIEQRASSPLHRLLYFFIQLVLKK